ELGPGGAAVEKSVAGGAGVSTIERGGGAGPLRGPVLAGLPSPRGDGLVGLRVPAAGAAPGAETAAAGPQTRGREPALTLPGIRRALQRLLLPPANTDSPS